MNRLILIASNKHFPALSNGAHQKAHPVLAARCAPAASPNLQGDRLVAPFPPRASLRGNLAPSSTLEGAPSFDATAERWIVPPSRMTREAASAEPRSIQSTILTNPADVGLRTAGRLDVREVLTTALGMTVVCLIAAFFLVLG